MQKPNVVVFDLGKVLLDFDYGVAVRNLVQHCQVTEERLHELLNQSDLLFRYETGLMSTSEFFEEVRGQASFCQGQETFEPIFGDIFQPIPEMIALNEELRAAGVPTYIFSNTNDMAIRHIRSRYPFFADFNAYILSYEKGAMKPSPAIYEVVENETGTTGSGILYIDDRLENVEQGAARGWQVVHHSSPRITVPHVKRALGIY